MIAELEGWAPLPLPTAPPPAGAVDALLAWAVAEGAWFEPIAIAVAADGNRGVVTRRAVAAGEPLVIVPRRLMITDVDVAAHPAVAPLVPHQDQLASRHSLVARWLVSERSAPASPWRRYLDALPPAYPWLPIHRPAAQLIGLAGTAALAAIVAQAESYRADHALIAGRAPDPPSLAEFAWGRAVAGSRCYGIAAADGSVRALVPVADMFDHGADAAHWGYDDAHQRFEVVAARALGAGEPVTISYGHHENAQLLSAYGFAAPSNPDDEIVIHLATHDGGRQLAIGTAYDPRFQLAMATALAWPDTREADALTRIAAAVMDRGATIALTPAASADDPAWAELCATVCASERAIVPAILAFVDEVTRGGCDRSVAAWQAVVDAIAPDAVGAARLMRGYAQVAIDHARPAAAD
ncbi:MAG: SET domain-containing protein [Myxococcales bacterium]|nr:SET domain-containing protein [Myxococcales bacterium]MBK7195500.1 SET domain-containing protein [Myxococcales bacterium]